MSALTNKLKSIEDDVFSEIIANNKKMKELRDKNWELRELAKHINRDRFNKDIRRYTPKKK